MFIYSKLYIIIISVIYFSFLLSVSEPLIDYKQNKIYQIKKINTNNSVPKIDGYLDDLVWISAPVIEDLIQQEPILNAPPTYNTEIKLLYDEENIYVYGKLYHNNPKKIAQHLCRRDDWMQCFENTSDWFTFDLDPLHSHNSGYIFAVNAAGVQLDALVVDDIDYDGEWNGIWFSEVSITDYGWNVEMKIPISNLNYNLEEESIWGLNFSRYTKSLNEISSWVVIPRHLDGIASKFGHLTGISLNQDNKKFQIIPYSSGGIDYIDDTELNEEYKIEPSDSSFSINEFNREHFTYGFDLKYKLFNKLLINATINPDYGQIELDPEEVNLSAYETFYPEKRQFFLENMSFFDLPIKLFYSRRVGQDSDIKWASKIVAPDYKNFMFSGIFAKENNRYIGVSRLEKNFLYGNSFIGLTSTFSKKDNNSNTELEKLSKAFSIDGIFNYLDNKLSLDAQLILSDNSNIFKKGKGMSLESSYSLDYIKYFFDIEFFDKNFNIDELGYLRRNNLKKIKYGIILRDLEPDNFSRSKSIKILKNHQRNMDEIILKDDIIVNAHLLLINNINFEIGGIYSKSYFDDYLTYDSELNQFGPIIPIPPSTSYYFIFESNPLNKIGLNAKYNLFKRSVNDWGDSNDNNDSYGIELILKPIYFITSKINYNRFNLNESLYFLETIEDEDNDIHYIFSKRTGLTDVFSFRLDGSLNTKTSIQLYTELYKNNFFFDDYRVLHESSIINNEGFPIQDSEFFNGNDTYPPLYFSSEEDFLDQNGNLDPIKNQASYLDPNDAPYFYSKYTNLNINCILKWEFNPASNFYFVWTYQKGVNGEIFNSFIDFLNYDKTENHNEIYNNNSIRIKIDYWFNL